jgi:hypothetical protein
MVFSSTQLQVSLMSFAAAVPILPLQVSNSGKYCTISYDGSFPLQVTKKGFFDPKGSPL